MRILPSKKIISLNVALPFLVALLFSTYLIPAKAAIDTYQFDKPEQYQRYLHLTKSLRCPQCQNQDIADSNAPIATNLRSIIHNMILEGKTDKEIIKFVVDRYGEFVLYKPRFDRETWLLWLGPGILAIIGTIIVLVISRKRSNGKNNDQEEVSLTENEKSKLKNLLSEDDK